MGVRQGVGVRLCVGGGLAKRGEEALKPSNTGWLIADVVADTFAFGWARTEADPALLALLADPQWQPYLVFPGDRVAPDRVVTNVLLPAPQGSAATAKRPLFVLLDGAWPEARKMFGKSPYLNHLPVLSLQPEALSRYRLRRTRPMRYRACAPSARPATPSPSWPGAAPRASAARAAAWCPATASAHCAPCCPRARPCACCWPTSSRPSPVIPAG